MKPLDVYEALIVYRVPFVAHDSREAYDLAAQLAQTNGHQLLGPPQPAPKSVRASVEAGQTKSHTQVCLYPDCGAVALREDWGPGWILCPTCSRIAPSAEEQRRMQEPWLSCGHQDRVVCNAAMCGVHTSERWRWIGPDQRVIKHLDIIEVLGPSHDREQPDTVIARNLITHTILHCLVHPMHWAGNPQWKRL